MITHEMQERRAHVKWFDDAKKHHDLLDWGCLLHPLPQLSSQKSWKSSKRGTGADLGLVSTQVSLDLEPSLHTVHVRLFLTLSSLLLQEVLGLHQVSPSCVIIRWPLLIY